MFAFIAKFSGPRPKQDQAIIYHEDGLDRVQPLCFRMVFQKKCDKAFDQQMEKLPTVLSPRSFNQLVLGV